MEEEVEIHINVSLYQYLIVLYIIFHFNRFLGILSGEKPNYVSEMPVNDIIAR